MDYWNFGVYADRAHATFCYAAFVRAETEREAVGALRAELTQVPMPLYIGPLKGQSVKRPETLKTDEQITEDAEVILVKVDQ